MDGWRPTPIFIKAHLQSQRRWPWLTPTYALDICIFSRPIRLAEELLVACSLMHLDCPSEG